DDHSEANRRVGLQEFAIDRLGVEAKGLVGIIGLTAHRDPETWEFLPGHSPGRDHEVLSPLDIPGPLPAIARHIATLARAAIARRLANFHRAFGEAVDGDLARLEAPLQRLEGIPFVALAGCGVPLAHGWKFAPD